jgi:hypothetical protein
MRALLFSILILVPATASATPPPEYDCEKTGAARFEVAPWIALGTGVRGRDGAQSAVGTVAMDVGVTVPVLTNLRVGAWASPGTTNFTSFDASAGGRLEVQTNDFNGTHSDLFGVNGRYSFILDVGGGHRFGREIDRGAFVVVRLAAGFTAPNLLYSLYGKAVCPCGDEQNEPVMCRPAAGVVAGARPFISMNRAVDGSRTEIVAGIEFEAIGAGWWLLGGR